MLEQRGFGGFVGSREEAKVGLKGRVSPVFREGVREDAEGVGVLRFLLVELGLSSIGCENNCKRGVVFGVDVVGL